MSFDAFHLAIHPCDKPQGILAKANEIRNENLGKFCTDKIKDQGSSPVERIQGFEGSRVQVIVSYS